MSTQRNIPFFEYPKLIKEYEKEVRARMDDVFARGAFITQKDLTEFEEKIAKYLNVKHCIGVANGTDGLIMAFRAAGMKPGDEAIMPSHTMVATPAAVHFAGGTPILCDSGADHMMDAVSVRKVLTKKSKFLVPVQLNGRTCDMDALTAIAKENNLTIIEDAAQALGSKFKNRYAGTFGAAGMFSFYPAKILGCYGDGGALVTDDSDMYEKWLLLRDHGRGKDGKVYSWGMNSRLDNLQAAIMDVKFKYYGDTIKRRRQIAGFYHEGLSQLKELVLPPAPDSSANHFDVFQNYEIECERRDELKAYLAQNGIGTLIQWGGIAVHQQPGLGYTGLSIPGAERIMAKSLMIPMNTFICDDDVGYIIKTIRQFYGLK